MSGAGDALQAAAMGALSTIEGLGVYEGEPVQAAVPHALVEAGLETEWGHKSGTGREVRLAVTIHDQGERPVRLRGLMQSAEEALSAISVVAGWQLVTLSLMRMRLVRNSKGAWMGAADYRARMLKQE